MAVHQGQLMRVVRGSISNPLGKCLATHVLTSPLFADSHADLRAALNKCSGPLNAAENGKIASWPKSCRERLSRGIAKIAREHLVRKIKDFESVSQISSRGEKIYVGVESQESEIN